MSDVQAYKLIIEHKDTMSSDEVRMVIEQAVKMAVDRFVGLAFHVSGECNFGKVISARLVVEHSTPLNEDKLGAILNFQHEAMRVADLFRVN